MANENPPRVEWLVFALVLMAAISLDVTVEEDVEDVELRHLSGTIELDTRSSMDALGFDGYEIGAIATLDLSVQPVTVIDCTDCSTAPIGIRMTGEVVLTELIDEAGRLGRIEAELNLTHLQDISEGGLIHREWISMDWRAGDVHSHWEIILIHDPPRWEPADRYDAAFIALDEGVESRTGPRILIGPLLDGSRMIEGCLPDSLGCRASRDSDIVLSATFSAPIAPVEISAPPSWTLIEGEFEEGIPSGLADMRQLLDPGDNIEPSTPWCSMAGPADAAASWNVAGSGEGLIAPMSIWLEALGLPAWDLAIHGGVWNEIQVEGVDCGSLIDENGVLRLGFSSYSA
jgi:hypothetical protein